MDLRARTFNFVFLDKVGKKLEAGTTGSTFDRPGKRADGLMLTRAEVSQYVYWLRSRRTVRSCYRYRRTPTAPDAGACRKRCLAPCLKYKRLPSSLHGIVFAMT